MAVTQTTDTCTNNHCTLSSIFKASTQALSEGNLKVVGSNSNAGVGGTQTLFDGAYWEIKNTTNGSASGQRFGVASADAGVDFPNAGHGGTQTGQNNYHVWDQNNTIYVNTGGGAGSAGTHSAWSSLTTNDIISFHVDGTDLKVRKNNDSFDTIVSSFTATDWMPFVESYNGTMELRFQADSWTQTLPTGAKAINTTNKFSANKPAIEDGSVYFNTSTWEGNGGGRRLGSFQPLTEAYSVSKSLIFNNDDSAYLTKTFSGAGNLTTYTLNFWLKRGNLSSRQTIYSAKNSTGIDAIEFFSDTINWVTQNSGGSVVGQLRTNRLFKDIDSWFMLTCRYETSNGTAGDRMRMYINGVEETDFQTDTNPSSGANTGRTNQSGTNAQIGIAGGLSSDPLDGYVAQVVFIDGSSLAPSSFGELDTTTNLWIPKDVSGLTFGTNGFYLDMAVAPGTGNGPGNDVSGNNNDFNVNSLAASDQSSDTPTNNFAVLTTENANGTITLSEGNLKCVQSGGGSTNVFGSIPISSGKFHYEVTLTNREDQFGMGIIPIKHVNGNTNQFFNHGIGAQLGGTNDGKVFDGNTHTDASTHATTINKGAAADGNTLACEIDLDNAQLEWFNNSGVSLGTYSFIKERENDGEYLPCIHINDNGTFVANFGQNTFTHTPTTGFNTIAQDNLPESSSSISDWVWIKNQDATDSHMLFDSVRGIQKDLHSDANSAQVTDNPNTLTRFLKAGAEVSNDVQVNTDGESYVAWNWAAGGNPTTDNISNGGNPGQTPTSGSVFRNGAASTTAFGSASIYPTRASINTTAGFSIVSFTGTSGNDTVAHGLGATPSVIFMKNLDGSESWFVQHASLGPTLSVILNTAAAQYDEATIWNDTAPDSNVFTVGGNSGTSAHIAYCFAEIPGFSKFGTYEGNGNANGTFVETGFKPALFFAKVHDAEQGWGLFDSGRSPINPLNKALQPNENAANYTHSSAKVDFLSNGVKMRGTYGPTNGSNTIVYFAWAEHPFAGSAPITAV